MFPYLFIVYLFTYFIVKHHFSPQVHRLFRTCICILYFLSHFHTCTRRDDSKQTSDKEEPSICLTRNLLPSFSVLDYAWVVVVVVVRYRVTIRMWPIIITRAHDWSPGHGARSCDTRDKISVIMIHPVHYCTHMWWWSVGWLKNFPSYNSLIS